MQTISIKDLCECIGVARAVATKLPPTDTEEGHGTRKMMLSWTSALRYAITLLLYERGFSPSEAKETAQRIEDALDEGRPKWCEPTKPFRLHPILKAHWHVVIEPKDTVTLFTQVLKDVEKVQANKRQTIQQSKNERRRNSNDDDDEDVEDFIASVRTFGKVDIEEVPLRPLRETADAARRRKPLLAVRLNLGELVETLTRCFDSVNQRKAEAERG